MGYIRPSCAALVGKIEVSSPIPLPRSIPLRDATILHHDANSLQILELCIATDFRWRKISLSLTSTLQDMFCDLKENSTGFLESFDVKLSDWSELQKNKLSTQHIFNTFYSSPSLRRVKWRSRPFLRGCSSHTPSLDATFSGDIETRG
jgi:hypothetical protein